MRRMQSLALGALLVGLVVFGAAGTAAGTTGTAVQLTALDNAIAWLQAVANKAWPLAAVIGLLLLWYGYRSWGLRFLIAAGLLVVLPHLFFS